METARSKTPLFLILALLVLGIATAVFFAKKYTAENPGKNTQTSPASGSDSITLTPGGKHVDATNTGTSSNPEELVGRISEVTRLANETGDIEQLLAMLGQNALTPAQSKHLQKLATTSRLQLDQKKPFSSVMELDNRWAINLADKSRIYLDLAKTADGKWQVDRIILPGGNDPNTENLENSNNLSEEKKATAVASNFLNAITQLDPAAAREHIDSSKVSYAKIAGLCIIFEEGKYKLAQDRPLRKMFLRDNTAGWLTRLQAPGNDQPAMFAISTRRADKQAPWKITEVNLDKLLADYANRVSGGDIYYTPLIKNPKGGDSLVIYFDLDSGELTTRTQRQLSIVASLLKTDTNKKLTITGHTDALGSQGYNLSLSEKRAQQVMTFLAQQGVAPAQMKISAFGKAKPRVPNTTESGKDAPDGRRANRRAEILLDF